MKTDDAEELYEPAVRLETVSHEHTANQLSTQHIMYVKYH